MRLSKELVADWDKKLKDAGFLDCENRGHTTFCRGHIRHHRYQHKGSLREVAIETEAYYRALAMAFWHSDIFRLHREEIERYIDTGNLAGVCKDTAQADNVRQYIVRKIPRVLEFVRKFDEECRND